MLALLKAGWVADRIAQLVGNLVENAIRYNRSGGWVKVSAGRLGRGSADMCLKGPCKCDGMTTTGRGKGGDLK